MLSANDAEFKVSMDAEMAAAIAEVVKDLPPALDLEFTDVQVDAAEAPVDAAPDVPVTPPPVIEAAPDRVKDLEAKLALRESEFEAKLKDIETRLKTAQDKPAPKPPENIARSIEEDPIGFFEKAGISPDQVARLVIAARLGDKAPDTIKAEIQRHKDKSEVAELRREIEAERTARIVERLRSGAETAISKSESPVLTAFRAVDAKELSDRVFEKVAQDARDRQLGPDGPFLPYEDALKAVETDLSKYHRAFAVKADAPVAASAAPTNVSTPPPAGTPGRQEVQRPRRAAPPRKPYWETDDVEAERVAALQESLQIARGTARA